MDKIVKKVLVEIEKAGFEAFIVGGFVRDKLLKKVSFDIDIATSALPKDLHKIFGKNKTNNYGGYSFNVGKFNFEITTYREDYEYVDRKPTIVKYISDINKDLERRDFTINTICMDKNGRVYYFENSKKDLFNHVIKSVGDSSLKIVDDPLRMLRAVRFASVLNFTIDEELKQSIIKHSSLVKTLSKERIKSELSKILLSRNYVYGFNLLKELKLLEELNIRYNKIFYSSDVLVMFSQIDIDEKYFTKNENNQIKSIKKILNYGTIDSTMLHEKGLYLCTVTGEVFGISKKEINKVYKSMWLNDKIPLSVSSYEIMEILGVMEGKFIGEVKEEIIKLILDKKLENNKKAITKYLTNRK